MQVARGDHAWCGSSRDPAGPISGARARGARSSRARRAGSECSNRPRRRTASKEEKKACARAENAPSAGYAHVRALRASKSIAAAGGAVVMPRLNMSLMLKSNTSLCMMEKLSLCALLCDPVSWRGLCACASAGRVREN